MRRVGLLVNGGEQSQSPASMAAVLFSAVLGLNNNVQWLDRRSAISAMGGSAFALIAAPAAAPAAGPPTDSKSRGLSQAELTKRLLVDIVDKRFMVTGELSEDLYSDSAKFQDEIDTYDLKNFVKGTNLLFDGKRSEFKLVGDLDFSNGGKTIRYRFDEILSFKIPLQPRSRVSGVVEFTRGEDGLIEKYREFWDQVCMGVEAASVPLPRCAPCVGYRHAAHALALAHVFCRIVLLCICSSLLPMPVGSCDTHRPRARRRGHQASGLLLTFSLGCKVFFWTMMDS